MTTQPTMLKHNSQAVFVHVGLVAGYGLGLIGYLWDWRQHLAGLHAEAPHITMYLGALLVLAVLTGLTPLWPRPSGYLASYLWLTAGIAIYAGFLFSVHHESTVE